MKNHILVLSFFVFLLGCNEAPQGVNIVYPENCFLHNDKGGYVMDITRPPFNADNTGKKDCSDALITAYDTLLNHLKKDHQSKPAASTIIYFPNGTYKVSKTIIYSGEPWMRPNNHENIQHVRFRGQSTKGTIIRLEDNAPGFEEGKSKPVISFGKHHQNNAVSSNFFENITINTGNGNPGAVALRFHGANNEAVRDVHIYSEDGAGSIGLDMPMGACQGVYKNILIEGFDYGIHTSKHLAKSLTFEFITIKNQHIAGFHLEESSVSMRKLTSINKVPALKLTKHEGLAVVFDCEFTGGDADAPAIDIEEGVLFARNISVSGYGSSVVKQGQTVVTGTYIDEFVSEEKVTLFDQEKTTSLNLPVEETPNYPWEQDLSLWTCVNDFGAVGDGVHDDTEAIQQTMMSGKPIIYFLPGLYHIDATIDIPATVNQINFMFSKIMAGKNIAPVKDMPMFRISGNSDSPLFLEDLLSWSQSDGLYCMIDHASKRTLVMKDFHAQRGRTYLNSVEGGKVFFENVSVRTHSSGSRDHLAYSFKGQQVWMRYFDPEYSIPELLVDNSSVWIMGFKTESHATSFEVINGGKLEILGGVVNSWGMRSHQPQLPVIINNESTVTGVFVTGGPESGEGVFFQTIIEETQNGDTLRFMWNEAYKRFGDQVVIPLYLGYKQN